MPTPNPQSIARTFAQRIRRWPFVVACVPLLLVACVSTPVYDRQMAAAESAVETANTTSTQTDAALELRIATDKLAAAQRAARSKQPALALQLAQQAELDAKVAVLTARSARALAAAQESQEAARILQQEMQRDGSR
ncbi:MAG: DUF4398 domain-containing protein [Aquimonas sp.]|nr:DUF4398 domain-containing protein [Aquimonas sp.]